MEKMSGQKSVRFLRSSNNAVGGLKKCESKSSLPQLVRSKGQNKNSDAMLNRKKKGLGSSSSSSSASHKARNVPRKRTSRNGNRISSEMTFLDHPEIIKNKAKKLMRELEKNHIILDETSIERIILGDPKEYLNVFKRVFQCYQVPMKVYLEQKNIKWNLVDLLAKLDGRITNGVSALYAALAQIFNVKPLLNPIQFMQNRFTIQKLILCLDIIEKLNTGDF